MNVEKAKAQICLDPCSFIGRRIVNRSLQSMPYPSPSLSQTRQAKRRKS